MTPEQDAKQAEKILRAWITDKTGTTDFHRAGFKCMYLLELVGNSFDKITQAAAEAAINFHKAVQEYKHD